jgi:hypothetical protein
MAEDIYIIEDALPEQMFEWAFEEFDPAYNFRYASKYESRVIPENLHNFYPTWAGLDKPGEGDSIGDNLQLIRIAVHAKLLAKKLIRKDLRLIRINTNIQKFGEEATFHNDGPIGSWTFLVYIMQFWNMEWGGDFIIQMSNRDYRSVPCFPNRAILFKGHLEHGGSAPNRLCNFIRQSIAFTFLEI